MPAQPLDNPLWASLVSHHAAFAVPAGLAAGSEAAPQALRYPAAVAPFLAVPDASALAVPAAPEALASADATVFVLGVAPRVERGWQLKHYGSIVQMICEQPVAAAPGPAVVPLGDGDRRAVLELTAAVYPHYFRARTMELGRYFGIYADGRLAAMAGERMGFPGYREISAVCVQPEFGGRGYARRLLTWLAADLQSRGAVPFLHASPQNERALKLYAQNGFRHRLDIAFWSLKPAEAGSGA